MPATGPLFGKRQIFQVASDGSGARGRQFVMNDVDSPKRSVSPGPRTFPSIPAPTLPSSPTPPPQPKQEPVLIFRVYFVEHVVGSSIETTRVRKMSLVYFTSDSSLTLLERHQDNSGLEQGVFLSRQQVTKVDGTLYKPADFTPGSHVTLCGHDFTVVDCDDATRTYFAETLAVTLPPRGAVSYPPTYTPPPTTRPHDWGRPTKVYADPGFEEDVSLGFYHRKPDTKRQFLENMATKLHFECEFDDRTSLYGDRRRFLLRVYLADDTVEIYEILPRNSGRDELFPRILRRQKLPLALPPSDGSKRAHLATQRRFARPSTADSARLSPVTVEDQNARPKTAPAPTTDFLDPVDIRCGERLPVFGKWLLIRRCDRFTRHWFQQRGIQQSFVEAPLPDATCDFEAAHSSNVIHPPPPTHSGCLAVGSDEDSRGNCAALVPKPHRPSFQKFSRLDGKVLRFTAKLLSADDPELSTCDGLSAALASRPLSEAQQVRRFIVSYFLSDDSVSIFESAEPNSGITPGKFLDRGRYRKAGATPLNGRPLAFKATLAHQRRVAQGHRFGYDQGFDLVVPASGGVDGCLTSIGTRLSNDLPRYFIQDDFQVGAVIEFAHAPGQLFKLIDADDYTKAYLGLAEPSGHVPPKLGVTLFHFQAFRKLAVLTKGCVASITEMLNRLIPDVSVGVPPRVLTLVLARMGVCPPAMPDDAMSAVLSAVTSPSGSVDINKFHAILRAAEQSNVVDEDKLDFVFRKLQAAALSSINHLRRMFRDVDVGRAGVITVSEMRRLLQTHNLDAGFADDDVIEFMERFPLASATARASVRDPHGVDWKSFLLALVDADTLSPKEVDTIVSLVCGAGAPLDVVGAGQVPGVPLRSESPSPVPGRVLTASVTAKDTVTPAASSGDVVSRMKVFFGPRLPVLLEAFQRFDSLSRGKLNPACFLAAIQSTGFDLSQQDREMLQECLFPTHSKLPTIDYRLFLETLLSV